MKSRSRLFDNTGTVYFIFLIFYLITRTSNFTGPHDSMTYLEMLRTREHLWHPHHLLYHQLSYYWLHFLKNFFPGTADYFLVESFSCVFGAGTVALTFLFFRKRFNLPVLTSWIGTCIVAFSYGIWFYSINVEVYAPSLFLTIACLYQLTRKEWDAKAVWMTAILNSLAILFHQMNVLMIPVVLYKIFEQRKNIFVLKSIFWYGFTGLVLVGGIYFLAGRMGEGHRDVKSWMAWIEGYTATDDYWRSLTWKTPLLAGTGFAHTIVGGHFVFHMGLEKLFSSFLSNHSLNDEFFLVRNMPEWMGTFLLVLSLLLVAIIFFLLIKFLSRLRWVTRNQFYIAIPLFLYLAVYSTYFLFWMPEILEFWIGQSVVFWFLLIGYYQPINKKFNILLTIVLALLILINTLGSIRPMQDLNNDIAYVRIQKVKQEASPGDVVLVQNPWLLREFLQYYTPVSVIANPKGQHDADSIRNVVHSNLETGKKVFIFIDRNEFHPNLSPVFLIGLLEENKGRAALLEQEPAEVWMLR